MNMKAFRVCLLSVLVILAAGPSLALAQACTAGDPNGGAGTLALPPCLQPISPLLICIQPDGAGSFTAQWGYESQNSECCPAYELPIRETGVGEDVRANFFSPAPIDRGQPTFFTPGINLNAFTTTWDGSPLTWTLRYFTLTPPFFADASVTAVADGNTPFCSTDCLGNPNGNAVIDRCGVCDGDGTSCLGCSDSDITTAQITLDSNALVQASLVNEALYRLRRVRKPTRALSRYIKATRTEAERLYNESWLSIWSVPSVITQCTNSQFCVTISSLPLLDPFLTNTTALRDLTLDVTKRIRRNAKNRVQRRRAVDLETRAQILLDLNIQETQSIPVNISSCSDN